MADDDSELRFDEMERDNLQGAISGVEAALAASTPGTREPLENFLRNAKSRVSVLEKKIKDAEVDRENHARDQMALADLATRETALNAKEKEAYSGFLKEEFFTKRDFAKLSEFYSHTWDRLSEGGKDQMSQRVWEGIRRDEYSFGDLPASVREKEAKHAYMRLHGSSISIGGAAEIPEQDRNEFLRTYESGKERDAEKILERQSFKKNMFRGAESKPVRHSAVGHMTDADTGALLSKIETETAKEGDKPAKAPAGSMAEVDFSSISLSSIKPAEHPSEGAIANLPRNQGSPVREA
jgi:hypothetical protein